MHQIRANGVCFQSSFLNHIENIKGGVRTPTTWQISKGAQDQNIHPYAGIQETPRFSWYL